MAIWILMGTTCYAWIIHQTLNTEEFVSIIKTLRVININYLNESIVFDIKLGHKICSFVVLYWSPSQSSDEFESFSKNLELILDRVMKNTPYMMVLLSDFNAKCTNWYKHDKTNFEGIAIENISSQCGLYQVINEPTHISENSSSCIDLIFTSQPNLINTSKLSSPSNLC